MAKNKKTTKTEKPKYDPNTKLGKYIQNSGKNLSTMPQKGYWENQRQQVNNYLAGLRKQKEQEQKEQEEAEKRAESERKTKFWQDLTKDYTYTDQGDQRGVAYAAKMMNDTPGAEEREEQRQKEREKRENQEKTQQWRDFSQSATNAKVPEVAYAAKMIYDTKGTTEEKKQKLNNFLKSLNKQANTEAKRNQSGSRTDATLSNEDKKVKYIQGLQQNLNGESEKTGDDYTDYQAWDEERGGKGGLEGRVTVPGFNTYMQGLQDDIAAGLYDKGNDIYKLSDVGLKTRIGEIKTLGDQANAEVERLKALKPDEEWEAVYDYVEGLNREKQDAAPDRQYVTMTDDEGNELDVPFDYDRETGSYILSPSFNSESEEVDAFLENSYQSREQLFDEIKNTIVMLNKGEKPESAADEEARKAQAMKKAKIHFDSYFYDDLFRNEKNQEALRNRIYGDIMGVPYATAVSGMTDEEKAELDSLIDRVIGIKNGTELKNAEEYANALANQGEELRAEQERRKSLANLGNWASEMSVSGDYDPSKVNVRHYEADYMNGDGFDEPQGNEADKAYYYANNVPEDLWGLDPDKVNKYYFIATNPDRLKEFNKLYNKDTEKPGQRSNMADMYLKGMEPYLNTCLSKYREFWVKQTSEDPWAGMAMRIMSTPIKAVGGVMGTIGAGLAALGNKDAQDKNSAWYLPTMIATTTQQHQNELAGEAAGDLVAGWVNEEYRDKVREGVKNSTTFGLGIVDSLADNIFSKSLGNAFFGNDLDKVKNVIQFVMSSEALSNTMVEQLGKNRNPTEAVIYAVADGLIEWVTEEKSIDKWLKNDYRAMLGDKKALRKAVWNAMLAEGSEGINADVLNVGVDVLMGLIYGHENELAEKYHDLVAAKMDPTAASKKVLHDKLQQVGLSGLAESISGGLLVGGQYVESAVTQRNIGSNINSSNQTAVLTNAASELNEETESYQLAQELQKKMESGKKVSNYEAGRLALSIINETNETIGETARNTLENRIAGDLEGKGVEKENARDLSGLIVKALEKGGIDNLSAEERRTINENSAALNTYMDYRFNKETLKSAKAEMDESTKKERGAQSIAAVLASKQTGKSRSSSQITGTYTINEDDELYTTAEGEKTEGPRGVVVLEDGKSRHAQLESFEFDNDGDGRLKYRVTINGETRLVTPDQIRTTNPGMGAIIESQAVNPGFYSPAYVNQMIFDMQQPEVQNQLGNYMIDATAIRYAAFQQTEMPQTTISADVAQRLYNMAQSELNSIRENETKDAQRNAHKAGEGSATYKNLQYGTQAFDDAINKLKISEEQKNDIRTMAALAVAAGMDVKFVDNAYIEKLANKRKEYAQFKGEASKLYGEEDFRGIMVNIEGRNYVRNMLTGEIEDAGTAHSIIVTSGHEFLHWLRRNSSIEAYDKVAKYVLDAQRKALGAKGLNEAIADYMNKQGLTLDRAMDEFIADSCDSIFTNKNVLDHIQKTNRSLYGQVKSFVQDLFGKVKTALAKLYPSMSEASRRMVNADMRKLGELVGVAWEEAVNRPAEGTGTETESSRFSKFVISKDTTVNDIINNNRDYIDETKNYLKQYGMKELLNPKAIYRELDGVSSENVRAWIRNAFIKKGKQITRSQIESFMQKDHDLLRNQASEIISGWEKLLNGPDIDPMDVNNTVAQGGSKNTRLNNICAVLFEGENGKKIVNTDTHTSILITEQTIDESLEFNDFGNANKQTVERILKNADKLLISAKYIGSHNNYEHPGNKVHFYLNAITDINNNKQGKAKTLDAVLFAVHDAIDSKQMEKGKEQAYVAEISVIKRESDLSPLNHAAAEQNELGERGKALHSRKDSQSIIQEAMNAVNAERVREFDAESLYESELRFSRAGIQKNNEGRAGDLIVDDIDKMRKSGEPSSQNIINGETFAVNMDEEYEAAVERGDIKTATELLMNKLKETEGVIPFIAPNWDTGEYRETAKQLKDADPEAIAKAADQMAEYVPDNAVLIPMPGRMGKVTSDSWANKLAEAISERTGRPVVIALEGAERESRQEAKHAGEEGASQEELGFRKVAELPEGTFPIFIDNVVGKGVTADAARRAMGGGITLAYTKTLRSPGIVGLKNAIVTYESKAKGGALIPLNERFNVSRKDVRFSRWTEQGMDVNYWMEHATPGMVQTEDERALIDAYRGKRISMSLSLKKQSDYKAKIRQLEAKAELSTEQKSELTALRNRLEIEQNKFARLEDEIFRITKTDGWAGAMYQHNMVFRDYIEGKTQDQVRKTVEEMLKKVEETQEQIRKDTEGLKKLADTQAVKTMKSIMGKTSLSEKAAQLRSYYNTGMTKAEISDRLAGMVLKMAQGQDISADAELLAREMLEKMRGVRSETLNSLKGTKLVIGKNILNQLKAEHTTLAEIRQRIKGSGVIIKTEENSRLDSQWEELRENNQSLPDISGMADADKLHAIVDFIESELRASTGSEQYDVDIDEAALFVKAMAGNISTFLTDDPKARHQIDALIKQIRELHSRTEKTVEDMEALDGKLDEVIQAGQRAQGMASTLENDVNEAIKYYNTTARVAAENERNKVRQNLIKQLRSETAQKLLKQQEAFNERLKNDKQARELAENNLAIRRKISTVATRMANRIFAETDQKNIPEEAKPLARKVLGMLSEHDGFFRKVTYWDKQQVENIRERLGRMESVYGKFNPDTDLNWLIHNPGPDEDDTAFVRVMQDMINIETGLLDYRNAEGKERITLQDRKAALTKIQESLSEIWSVIQARGEAEIEGRKWQIYDLAEMMRDEFANSRFKGERTGFGRRARNSASGLLTWGNLTPEYFFKMLRNKAMDLLHDGLKDAENRSGLEWGQAKLRLAEIAEKTGFATWDGQEEHKVQTRSGNITMTTEQIMALYATWLREKNQMRPEETAHLLHGGFVLAPNEDSNGLPGREKRSTRPIRISEAQLNALGEQLTDQQKAYVHAMVEYMSNELAELGNEASMRMYGIKKFTEKFYFPIKSWRGVTNKRSDAGVNNNNENRAAQQGFSKRVKNNARNAIEISDFTPTAVNHVVGMINYNTVGPAIENLNKVLNQQLTYGEIREDENGEELDDTYKRNMRAAFEEAYGTQAGDYLAQFMKDMNGGTTQTRTAFDKLLSVFKKNAVAGSLSVAAQQPLSYIRAAMLVNPKYLAQAISPAYWKGSYAEMMKWSGLAVIKEMGKFDMNYGRSAQEWITPEGYETKAKKALKKTTDALTVLPQKMDAMTWTRMWTAAKLEQMAQNKGMDFSSDEFMEKVAKRFNDLMRQTQVYDSVMTKSQNMRNQDWKMRSITSFMAEPTLTLNVLADALQNIGEKGGKRKAITALATFLLSAAAQAGVKGFFSTGRSPDKKKNREENFLNKFLANLISEVNPLGLIPGYRALIDVMTDGEVSDDAMGMIGKAMDVFEKTFKMITERDFSYRGFEDSVGQMLQMFSDVPLKNMMRDFRAMVNFFSNGNAEGLTGNTYAKRPTDASVLKYSLYETLMKEDLIGMLNKRLGDAGYGTANKDYYERIYEAEKAGEQQAADEMRKYLEGGRGTKPETIDENLRKIAKGDSDMSAAEQVEYYQQHNASQNTQDNIVMDGIKNGTMSAEEARKLLKQIYPEKSDNDIWWTVDRAEWTRDKGLEKTVSGQYYRFKDAIENGKQADMNNIVKTMIQHGMKKENIINWIGNADTGFKPAYLSATGKEKDTLRLKLIKAYKAAGLTEQEAIKKINDWKTTKKKDGSSSAGNAERYSARSMTVSDVGYGSRDANDTTGRYGRGNIDLNNRQMVRNKDGSISTERSFSVNIDGKEVLLPTVINGRIVSEDEAIDHYLKTGEYLGKFNTVKEADEYAEKLHNRQDWYYNR